jgi:hypothetical protein
MTSQLVDMEWKFGVTASTSEIDKIGNPFLQLKLVLNVGEKLETHYMGKKRPCFVFFRQKKSCIFLLFLYVTWKK